MLTYCISILSLRVIFFKTLQLKSHQEWKLREYTLPSESRQISAPDNDIDDNQDCHFQHKLSERNLTLHFNEPERKVTQYLLSKSYDYINEQCGAIKVATM